MTEKIIAPRYLYYFINVTHVGALIVLSIMFKGTVEAGDLVPMAITGGAFVVLILFILFHCNRMIYFRVLPDNRISYNSLFVDEVVSLERISKVQHVWTTTYLVRID
jgi:hypothetical protein